MNLGDGFRIHVVHLTRHTQQIERLVVNLDAGKYWYKFIADGNWMIDKDNIVMMHYLN